MNESNKTTITWTIIISVLIVIKIISVKGNDIPELIPRDCLEIYETKEERSECLMDLLILEEMEEDKASWYSGRSW